MCVLLLIGLSNCAGLLSYLHRYPAHLLDAHTHTYMYAHTTHTYTQAHTYTHTRYARTLAYTHSPKRIRTQLIHPVIK